LSLLATILVLALTRAEIVARMKAPVVTQCGGLVQVYADCPEDMRREFQSPVASFAAETANTLMRGLSVKPVRYREAPVRIHLGDVRTNDTAVVAKVSTNGSAVVTRLFVPSPGFADLRRFRLELIKAYARVFQVGELSDDGAADLYRKADPAFRLADERAKLDDWLAGHLPSPAPEDDEANLARMHKVLEPGVASRTDVMIFASRLFLYPPTFDRPFCGRFDCLSFREAVPCARVDRFVRLAAYRKADYLLALGGGRSRWLDAAAKLYFVFLLELARNEKDEQTLLDLLDKADAALNLALENAGKRD